MHELIPGEDNLVQFPLYLADGTKLQASATIAAGDFKIIVDGAVAANVTNAIVNEGNGVYSCTIDATETAAGDSQLSLIGSDATATQTFLDTVVKCRVLSLGEVQSRFYPGPEGPGIYIDSTNGTAGSTLGVHGTPESPTTTWASALTLAGKLGIDVFYLSGQTSITLTGDSTGYVFVGDEDFSDCTVNCGSQIISNCRFKRLTLTGTASSSSDHAHVEDCYINGVTNAHFRAFRCGLAGTTTLTNNDDHVFDSCFSAVAGGGSPGITLVTNADANFRHYSGGITINSGGSTNNFSLEGHGKVTIAATCNNFTIQLRGHWEEADSGSNTTINDDASFSRTGGIPVSPVGQISGTVSTTNLSSTSCSSNLFTQGYTIPDLFRGRTLEWLTGNLAGAVSYIFAYDHTNGDLTFSLTPNETVPANGDTFRVL